MVVWSAGIARRIVSLTSSPRAAKPTPSSEKMIEKRSATGRRMMLSTRSGGIGDVVCSTGIVAPESSSSPFLPGWQSTKYSPISDCGLIVQVALSRRPAKPSPPLLDLDGDQRAGVLRSTSRSAIEPTATPPTLKSAPLTSPKALSKTILYFLPLAPSPAPSGDERAAR